MDLETLKKITKRCFIVMISVFLLTCCESKSNEEYLAFGHTSGRDSLGYTALLFTKASPFFSQPVGEHEIKPSTSLPSSGQCYIAYFGKSGLPYAEDTVDASGNKVGNGNGIILYSKDNIIYYYAKSKIVVPQDFSLGSLVNEKTTAIDLSGFDLSNVSITSNWFENGSNLQSIVVGDNRKINSSESVAMFKNCSYVTEELLNHFDFSSCEDMSQMFYGAGNNSVASINMDTSNAINMKEMFKNSKFTILNLKTFDTSNVTDMSYMFDNSELQSIDLSNFKTSKVENLSCMFKNCSNLITIDFSSAVLNMGTSISYMFKDCSKLTTIYAKSDANWAYDCTGGHYSSLSLDDTFEGCISIVGGAGTTYADWPGDKDGRGARIDGIKSVTSGQVLTGFFTAK